MMTLTKIMEELGCTLPMAQRVKELMIGSSFAPEHGSALAARLRECSDWHKRESKRHREEREMREQCNLGPPHPKKYENQHAMFAQACLDAIAPNAELRD